MKKILIYVMIFVFTITVIFVGSGCKTTTTATTEAEVVTTAAAEATTVAETATATTVLQPNAPAMAAKSGKVQFAFCFDHMTEFYNLVYMGIQKGVAEVGGGNIDLKWTSPGETIQAEKQLEEVNNYIRQKVDALTLTLSMTPTTAIFSPAKTAGIPIFFVNQEPHSIADLDPSLWVAISGYDGFEAGKLVGEWVLSNVTPGKVAIVRGEPSIYDTGRRTGFVDKINGSGFNVVAEVNGHWTREGGMAAAESMIQANPDLTLIYALCDDEALGAQQAVEAAGLKDKVKVVGVDGTKGAIESIKAGGLAGTLNTVPFMQGNNIVKVMYDYVGLGKQVERYSWAPIHVTDKTNVDKDLTYFQ